MTKKIQDQVAENRNQTRRLDAQFVNVSTQNDRNLTFTNNYIEVEVQVEVYQRDLGPSLISGHPDPSHGAGRGEAGDQRTAWSQQSVTVSSEVLVRGGRNAVRDALDGSTGAVNQIGVGTGSDDPASGDTALTSETTKNFCWGQKDSGNVTRARSSPFLFAEYGDTVQEFGVFDQDDRLLERSVLSNLLDLTNEKELRVDVTFTFTGDAIGDAVITDDGETALADSIASVGSVVGLKEVNYGTGTTQPSESDTALAAEEIAKDCFRNLDAEQITTQAKLFDNEPNSQPVDLTEIGVTDNNDRLVYRTLIKSFEKNSQFEVNTTIGFIIQSK
ncbi:hypothetical protein HVTV-2_gp136 [Haloarcula virus HVTV-2]|uniref:Uncharacterized protein n=1 Tax=Haloarcula vallismortis tailed virus 1 TaxID=1262528 RepID=L7TH12_9CAUD|nr:hypothetical protein HVTV1_135 [Haloarcula vallismortis tailed virus 1]AGC34504.1 hypothetical protein HVTV1_135 [Haloarcula vallismortis tailed virus 1]UBF22943.1 hypothetical protein HVTV-2_gp136 [Haloarcula virus HVTV-2]